MPAPRDCLGGGLLGRRPSRTRSRSPSAVDEPDLGVADVRLACVSQAIAAASEPSGARSHSRLLRELARGLEAGLRLHERRRAAGGPRRRPPSGARSTKPRPRRAELLVERAESLSIFFRLRSMRAISAPSVTRPLRSTSTSMGPCELAAMLAVVPGSRGRRGLEHQVVRSERRGWPRRAREGTRGPRGWRSGRRRGPRPRCSRVVLAADGAAGGDDLLEEAHPTRRSPDRAARARRPGSGRARTRGSPCARPGRGRRCARAPR